MEVQRGLRDKLSKYLDTNSTFEVLMQTVGNADYDYSCFGVDAQDKLSDDRYMIFYNQVSSPKGEINYQGDSRSAKFIVRLSKLPSFINKLAFTVSIDGDSDMSKIQSHRLSIVQNGRNLIEFKLKGTDFQKETSLISIEIYKKGEWRFAAIGSGFNGGLGDLLRNYGGEEDETEEQPSQPTTRVAAPTPAQPRQAAQPSRPQPQPSQPATRAAAPTPAQPRQVAQPSRPQPQPSQAAARAFTPAAGAVAARSVNRPVNNAMLNEAVQNVRKVLPGLDLTQCRARIVLAIEASKNTAKFFSDGSMQNLITKVLPLAMQFSANAQLDYWLYSGRCKKMFPIGERNYAAAIPNDWGSLMWSLGENKTETTAMTEILSSCQPFNMPTYILFITSGNVALDNQIEQMVVSSSQLPVFWQFLGMGGNRYGVFERIQNLSGAAINNAKFAAISGFSQHSTPELYKFLLGDFSKWRKEAIRRGITS